MACGALWRLCCWSMSITSRIFYSCSWVLLSSNCKFWQKYCCTSKYMYCNGFVVVCLDIIPVQFCDVPTWSTWKFLPERPLSWQLFQKLWCYSFTAGSFDDGFGLWHCALCSFFSRPGGELKPGEGYAEGLKRILDNVSCWYSFFQSLWYGATLVKIIILWCTSLSACTDSCFCKQDILSHCLLN